MLFHCIESNGTPGFEVGLFDGECRILSLGNVGKEPLILAQITTDNFLFEKLEQCESFFKLKKNCKTL